MIAQCGRLSVWQHDKLMHFEVTLFHEEISKRRVLFFLGGGGGRGGERREGIHSVYNLGCLFCPLLFSFSKLTFRQILSGIPSECQTVKFGFR